LKDGNAPGDFITGRMSARTKRRLEDKELCGVA
jgi:hypothetical protein